MFGIDWDGDGEDTLFDDMITMDLLDEDEGLGQANNSNNNRNNNSEPNGSCLLFLICMGAAICAPIALLVNLLA